MFFFPGRNFKVKDALSVILAEVCFKKCCIHCQTDGRRENFCGPQKSDCFCDAPGEPGAVSICPLTRQPAFRRNNNTLQTALRLLPTAEMHFALNTFNCYVSS